jgi:hypothetical protein
VTGNAAGLTGVDNKAVFVAGFYRFKILSRSHFSNSHDFINIGFLKKERRPAAVSSSPDLISLYRSAGGIIESAGVSGSRISPSKGSVGDSISSVD